MNVLKIESKTVKTYTVHIDDGEVRPKPYSRAAEYRVERVVIVKQDGNVSSVEFRGYALKKDGTASLNPARESFYGRRGWPEWLDSIVGGLA